jgi:hypothetical protein
MPREALRGISWALPLASSSLLRLLFSQAMGPRHLGLEILQEGSDCATVFCAATFSR